MNLAIHSLGVVVGYAGILAFGVALVMLAAFTVGVWTVVAVECFGAGWAVAYWAVGG